MIKKNIFIFIGFIIFFLMGYFKIIDIAILKDHHFDMITVNSIFAGFTFSALSLIVALGSNKTIILLERINAMNKIYDSIKLGIVFNIISILCSLINIFLKDIFISNIVITLYLLELYFLISSIFLFILSIKYLNLIIKGAKNEIKTKIPNRQLIKDVIDGMGIK